MPMPSFSMRQLLEAGVHFGHHTRRWNPQMAPYIFGVRNNVHIIDLAQTVPMLHRALQAIRDVAAGGGGGGGGGVFVCRATKGAGRRRPSPNPPSAAGNTTSTIAGSAEC